MPPLQDFKQTRCGWDRSTPTASTRRATDMRRKEKIAEEMRRTVLDKVLSRGENRLNKCRNFRNRMMAAHT